MQAKLAAHPPQHILIVRPSALGDVARSVGALTSLRAAWPDARIDWLVHEAFADVIRHHPALNGVVLFARRRFGAAWRSPAALREAWQWARDLRRREYDLVLDFQGLLRSGLFTWLTHAPRRIGYRGARELAWLGYNRRHRINLRQPAVDRVLALLKAEGVPARVDMRLYVGAEDQKWLSDFRGRHVHPGQAYAVIAPTARWLCKCWPLDRYIAIARRLLDSGLVGRRLVVLAAPAERQYVQPLIDALTPAATPGGAPGSAAPPGSNAAVAPVLFPTTTVGQMMALVSQAGLVVCNDSAAQHLAVAFERPLVAIFGPTDPTLEGPYRRMDSVLRPPGMEGKPAIRHRHMRNDQSIIAGVTVEAVWEKMVEETAKRRSDEAT